MEQRRRQSAVPLPAVQNEAAIGRERRLRAAVRHHGHRAGFDVFPAPARRPHYAYQPPAAADGLATASLAAVGLNPAPLREMVQALVDEREYPGVPGVLVWHRGKLALEEYFYGYDRQKLHLLRSASKSFVSALVGAAIQRQAIKSEQDRVLPYFKYPGYTSADPRKQAWTVRGHCRSQSGPDFMGPRLRFRSPA